MATQIWAGQFNLLQDMCRRQQQKIDKVNETVEILQSEKTVLQTQLNNKNTTITRLENENKELNDRIRCLNQNLADTESDLKHARKLAHEDAQRANYVLKEKNNYIIAANQKFQILLRQFTIFVQVIAGICSFPVVPAVDLISKNTIEALQQYLQVFLQEQNNKVVELTRKINEYENLCVGEVETISGTFDRNSPADTVIRQNIESEPEVGFTSNALHFDNTSCQMDVLTNTVQYPDLQWVYGAMDEDFGFGSTFFDDVRDLETIGEMF